MDEAYKNSTESIPVADAVFELSVMMDADEVEIEAAVMEIRKTQRGRRKLYINDSVYLAWVYYMKMKAMRKATMKAMPAFAISLERPALPLA